MVIDIDKKFKNKHDLDIGSFYFYENFIIGEVGEGMSLDFESGNKLYQLIDTHYKKKVPYVYISNRIHSYSFTPTRLYGASEHFPNLKGYAIVTYDTINNKVAQLEKKFSDIPTSLFNNLGDAILWAEELISEDP
ncbi:hypothetical protein [Aquimarina sp. MMG016]|uniref:hypothetical protein n=1 Tax=Aquimarina sp. MMG016 TaxID=2822690 RepID=UPI001B3A64D8|nr:hypothetical protein [Aquimarina sp. MMG016]MBQ4820308.1 hypothetical protein [Aquimarina sp. MMG016]